MRSKSPAEFVLLWTLNLNLSVLYWSTKVNLLNMMKCINHIFIGGIFLAKYPMSYMFNFYLLVYGPVLRPLNHQIADSLSLSLSLSLYIYIYIYTKIIFFWRYYGPPTHSILPSCCTLTHYLIHNNFFSSAPGQISSTIFRIWLNFMNATPLQASFISKPSS